MNKVNEWLDKDKLTLLTAWARDGLTNEQIAKNIGIATSTLYNWQKKHLEILDALKKGKEVVDFEVENALLKKALGYDYIEQTKELTKDPLTNKVELRVVKEVKKHMAPDTTAQIFWLKNRKPDNWRDKVIDVDNEEVINNAKDILVKIKKVADERNTN